jgi:uncharacterized membrane protein YdfJ with MMPL/SSD domain
VLPALMAKLGDRVNRGRIPILGRRRPKSGESRAWTFVLDRVMQHPALSAALAIAALVALATPGLTLRTQLPSFTDLPKSLSIVKTYDRVQAAFPGSPAPAEVVVEAADVTAPSVRRGIAELRQKALASHEMAEPIQTQINASHTVARISIPLAGDGNDTQSQHALTTLRTTVIPATIGAVAGTAVAVTGETAGSSDFNDTMKSHMPLVFAFALAFVFVLMLATFRSIVVPLKAVALNLLSVAAAYGVLVAVFQHR